MSLYKIEVKQIVTKRSISRNSFSFSDFLLKLKFAISNSVADIKITKFEKKW